MRRRLHRCPDIRVAQNAFVVAQANPFHVIVGRFTRKLVKLSRMVQISGKIFTASNRKIVGATNIHAIVRSDKSADALGQRIGRFCSRLYPWGKGHGVVLVGERARANVNESAPAE